MEVVISKLLNHLNFLGIYVYHKAVTKSTYLKFKDNRIGSIRVSDHAGRRKYTYRWQLRTDVKEYRKEIHKGHVCHIYPITMVDACIRHITNYANVIKNNTKE